MDSTTQGSTPAKLSFWDFDATLADSPLPEVGKPRYEALTGTPYPHKGWGGRPESLSPVFNVQPHPQTLARFREQEGQGFVQSLLTNRIPRLERAIKSILVAHDIVMDEYTFATASKGERVKRIVERHPSVEVVRAYDDDVRNLINIGAIAGDAVKARGGRLELYHVVNGEIHLWYKEAP